MKRKIIRDIFFVIAVILAAAAILPFGAVKTLIGQNQPPQTSAALTQSLVIPAKGGAGGLVETCFSLLGRDGRLSGQATLASAVAFRA